MTHKEKIIQEQKDYITAVMQQYKLTLTEIARKIKVSQTTITRFYNNNPKNALGAITEHTLKAAFPLIDPIERSEKDQYGKHGSELGLLNAVYALFAILAAKNIVKESEIKDVVEYQIRTLRTQNQPDAVAVMEQLLESLGLRPQESKLQPIRTLLQSSPAV